MLSDVSKIDIIDLEHESNKLFILLKSGLLALETFKEKSVSCLKEVQQILNFILSNISIIFIF
jgi:hypothetical protein